MPYKDPAKARSSARRASARYRAVHPERAHAANAAYKAAYPERVQATQAAYRAAHPDERRILSAAYHFANREKVLARNAAWRAAHPENRRESGHRYRARLQGQFVAPVDAQAIYVRDRGRCHICGKHVNQVDASMDHLVPISLGGIHAPWNVALAHRLCNIKRKASGPAQSRLAIGES